jgi:hypothetical protein
MHIARCSIRQALARALILASTFVLTGCGYTYHFRNADQVRGEEHNEWASFFLFGIVGDYELDVREFCPQGVAEITTGTNFLTWFVSTITIGIYTPRKVNIWCATGEKTASFEVDFGKDGKPVHVTKREGARTYSGGAKPTADGRFAVMLREGDAR